MKTQTKTIINEQEYEVGVFPAMYAHRLSLRLLKVLENSLPKFFGIFQEGLDGKLDLGAFGGALSNLTSSIYDNDPQGELILELMAQTLRNGVAINKDTFNQFYTSNLDEMYRALFFSIKTHFAHFFSLFATGNLLQSQVLTNSAVSLTNPSS